MIDLTSLISRLEKATEGSRELDAEIAVAIFKADRLPDDLGYVKKTVASDQCAPGMYWYISRSGKSLYAAPRFTTSVDAAISLVPDGWHIYEMNQKDPTRKYSRHAAKISPFNGNDKGWAIYKAGLASATAETLAVAVCIAALRVRQAMTEQEKEG